MEMPQAMKDLGAMLAVTKLIQIFADMTEAAEKATPEIQDFVKKYVEELESANADIESVFGKNYLD